MYKSFKTDSERNAVFTHMSNVAGLMDNVKYIDGVLCKDNILVTDQKFIASMERMFDSMEKLAALNKVVA
jgi:hypothetical protein